MIHVWLVINIKTPIISFLFKYSPHLIQESLTSVSARSLLLVLLRLLERFLHFALHFAVLLNTSQSFTLLVGVARCFGRTNVSNNVTQRPLVRVRLQLHYTVDFGKFQPGVKATNWDFFDWNFHSFLKVPRLTHLSSFRKIFHPEVAEILVRKSGFLQITKKTYTLSGTSPRCVFNVICRLLATVLTWESFSLDLPLGPLCYRDPIPVHWQSKVPYPILKLTNL